MKVKELELCFSMNLWAGREIRVVKKQVKNLLYYLGEDLNCVSDEINF